MADRTSALIFGAIFNHLAETPDDRSKSFAWEMWALKEEAGCDFYDYQMDADDALIALGLACRGVDPRWPDEGEVTLYAGVDGGPERPRQ